MHVHHASARGRARHDERVGAPNCLYARGARATLDVFFSLSLCVVEFPVHGKLRSLSSLSLGPLGLSLERPPFQARVAYGLTLAAALCVWPLARHLI